MRKDIAELLEAMHPKFMRFPGGCLVHDGSLDENDRVSMYRWKNTIGPLESRPARRNNWGYHQTLGLGYYEYFQFCEDIGAKPLPVLPGGWDPHHQRAVPLEELTSWVDDALDLIEFANGGVDTKWGAVRAELGHPEPFGLEYLAIGNEEVGQGFFERFERFYSAIRARAPEIKIIGTSGPFAAGGEYTRGWKYARELGVDLVDEHYYQAPEWFQANIHRYDNFPEDGPKVFLGEYASQGNMWYNAVTEAAYMIGLEKAPAVGLACYAPMLCNVNYVNWKPDMIFFDNHRAYGTPNYYVQKLFMLHQGDALLPLEGLSVQPSTISQPLAGPVIMRAGSSEFAVSNLRLTEANKTKYLPDFVLAMGQEAAIGHTDGGDFTLEWDAVELRHEPSKGEYGNCGLRLQFGNNISDEAMEWSLGGWQNSDSIINRFYGGKGTCRSQSEFSFLVGQRRHFLLKGSGRKILAFIDGESCHDVEDRLPQLEPLYASACLNRSSRTVVIKVVNLCGDAQIAAIDLPEWVERSMKGRKTTMAYAPEAENDFDRPENVVPVDEPFFMNGTELRHTFPPCSLTIFDIVIEK